MGSDSPTDTATIGLDHLEKLISRLLSPMRVEPLGITVAFARAPWWDQGAPYGVAGDTWAPDLSSWATEHPRLVASVAAKPRGVLESLFDRRADETRAFADLVAKDLADFDQRTGVRSILGRGCRAGGLDLIPIIHFSDSAYEALPHLPLPKAAQRLCVVDEIVRCALDRFDDGVLTDPLSTRGVADVVFRDAGARFMSRIRGVHKSGFFQNLFATLSEIAWLRYEGSECRGQLLFASKKTRQGLTIMRFADRVPLTEFVWVRKLLETASEPYALVSDGTRLIGIACLSDVRVRGTLVRFQGQGRWTVESQKQMLMTVRHGLPSLPARALPESDFVSTFNRLFPGANHDVGAVWKVIESVLKARSGAIVIVSEDAATEAKRLREQTMRITPRTLTRGEARRATKIDGALLIDTRGVCHGIGTILDGKARRGAVRSRGSRFNSALRYVLSAHNRIGLVVSEDGKVDLLPRLRTQTTLSELQECLGRIRARVGTSASLRQDARLVLQYSAELGLDRDDWFEALKHSGKMRAGIFDPPEAPDTFDVHRSDLDPSRA